MMFDLIFVVYFVRTDYFYSVCSWLVGWIEVGVWRQ